MVNCLRYSCLGQQNGHTASVMLWWVGGKKEQVFFPSHITKYVVRDFRTLIVIKNLYTLKIPITIT